jgi:PAS domain-containing protein
VAPSKDVDRVFRALFVSKAALRMTGHTPVLRIGHRARRLNHELLDGELLDHERVKGELVDDALMDGERVKGELVDDALMDGERVKGELVDDALMDGERVKGEQVDDALMDGELLGLARGRCAVGRRAAGGGLPRRR